MHRDRQSRKASAALAAAVALFFLLGCRLVTESLPGEDVTRTVAPPAPTATATLAESPSPQPATATNTPRPSVTPTDEPTAAPSATATGTPEAGAVAAWLVYRAADGLMVLPPGSNEPAQVAPSPIHQWEASTAGGRLLVAFVTGAPDGSLRDLRLEVHAPGEGAVLLSLPLTSPETAVTSEHAHDDPNFEIARALTEVDSLAWSPAGDRVAFTGAHQGPGSDLYVYDVAGGGVTRLSSEPGQAIKPVWSPDGAYIVHLAVSTLGSGAGYGVEGMWAAGSDGEEIVTLDLPDDSRDEVWLGWHGDHTLLVHSFNPSCGDNHLRAVDVAGGGSRTLWRGAFNAAAFAPTSGHVLLSVHAGTGPCSAPTVHGLLLTFPQAQDSYVAHDTPVETARDLAWSPTLAAFLAAEEDGMVVTVTTAGEAAPLPSPIVAVPTISPDGLRAAWAGEDGLWIGRVGEEAPQVFDNAANLPLWTPNGSLLFFGAAGIYRAAAPDFTPNLVVPGTEARDAVLLETP